MASHSFSLVSVVAARLYTRFLAAGPLSFVGTPVFRVVCAFLTDVQDTSFPLGVQLSCQGGTSGNLLREHRHTCLRRETVPSQAGCGGVGTQGLRGKCGRRRGRPHSLRASICWTKAWISFCIQCGSRVGFEWWEQWLCAGAGDGPAWRWLLAVPVCVHTHIVYPSAVSGHWAASVSWLL